MKHILSGRQFTTTELGAVFERADYMRGQSQDIGQRRKLMGRQAGRIMTALFYEPSTRTRLSFVSAAKRLGMHVIETENAAEFSSAAKGETIEDSTRVVAGYSDVIVMRHRQNGAAERAAAVSKVPVINAGDGTGEHPTQALLDLYTIQDKKDRLDGLHVVVGGDLKHGRTARSLTQLLALYPDNHFSFVSTADLGMGEDVKEYLSANGSTFTETDAINGPLRTADVVYWTRMQTERLTAGEEAHTSLDFILGQRALEAMRQDAIIMHPLPRVGEIDPIVDDDPRAAYFEQAQNGLYVRMALLDMV
ncbi:MAG TPA: aspartate carbamoyltransferase [Candidatus Saccharimonadales bacterium]|nr:aspartate carbamoyltransferase [Candidatus Saccharimonadales bacterium]